MKTKILNILSVSWLFILGVAMVIGGTLVIPITEPAKSLTYAIVSWLTPMIGALVVGFGTVKVMQKI